MMIVMVSMYICSCHSNDVVWIENRHDSRTMALDRVPAYVGRISSSIISRNVEWY